MGSVPMFSHVFPCFSNIATGHMDKVKKLKTRKSKEKYLDLAKEALNEGLEEGLGQGTELRMMLSQIEIAKDKLE